MFIDLLEEEAATRSFFRVDLKSDQVSNIGASSGTAVARTGKYWIEGESLATDNAELVDADQVLYECSVDGMDIVVIRDEYNSFESAWNIFAALSGHPLQVSRIIVVVLRKGEVVAEHELIRKPASYKWQAVVLL